LPTDEDVAVLDSVSGDICALVNSQPDDLVGEISNKELSADGTTYSYSFLVMHGADHVESLCTISQSPNLKMGPQLKSCELVA
jgi:hypothetical protein